MVSVLQFGFSALKLGTNCNSELQVPSDGA